MRVGWYRGRAPVYGRVEPCSVLREFRSSTAAWGGNGWQDGAAYRPDQPVSTPIIKHAKRSYLCRDKIA